MERYGIIRQDGSIAAYTFTEAEARRVLARASASGPHACPGVEACPGVQACPIRQARAGLRIGVYRMVRDPGCTEYLQLVGCADPGDHELLEALKIKARADY